MYLDHSNLDNFTAELKERKQKEIRLTDVSFNQMDHQFGAVTIFRLVLTNLPATFYIIRYIEPLAIIKLGDTEGLKKATELYSMRKKTLELLLTKAGFKVKPGEWKNSQSS